MTLCLTNTMKRTKEPFAPANPDHVTMYVCGPTVYNFAHVGNARPAVVFDVLYRLVKRRFRRVDYARNFTDVDDKINAAAKEAGHGAGVGAGLAGRDQQAQPETAVLVPVPAGNVGGRDEGGREAKGVRFSGRDHVSSYSPVYGTDAEVQRIAATGRAPRT